MFIWWFVFFWLGRKYPVQWVKKENSIDLFDGLKGLFLMCVGFCMAKIELNLSIDNTSVCMLYDLIGILIRFVNQYMNKMMQVLCIQIYLTISLIWCYLRPFLLLVIYVTQDNRQQNSRFRNWLIKGVSE